MFRTPVESSKVFDSTEIENMPTDYALDQLTSSRCLKYNANKIASYYHYQKEERKAWKIYFNAEFGTKHAAKWRKKWKELSNKKRELQSVYYDYKNCKNRELTNIIMRKTGKYISPELRKKIREFSQLIEINSGILSIVKSEKPTLMYKGAETKNIYRGLMRELPRAAVEFIEGKKWPYTYR